MRKCSVVTVIETLQWRSCFSFWPSEGGGVQGQCSNVCQEGAQMHRAGKKEKKPEKKKKEKRKKKKENGLTVRLYIGFMPLAV